MMSRQQQAMALPKEAKPTPLGHPWVTTKVSTGPWRTVPDPSLAVFAEWKAAEEEAKKAHIEMLATARRDGVEDHEIHMAIARYGVTCRRMLKAALHPSQHDDPRIDGMSITQMDEVLNALEWPDLFKAEPISYFTFKPAMLPQDAPPGGTLFYNPTRRQARKLHGDGWFILIPVAHLPLRSRMHTDAIREKWPHMPKELRDMLLAPQSVIDESVRADNALKAEEWMAKAETAKWQDLHRIIAHICVPAHDPVYDEAKAEARAESFKHLPVSIAFRVASFIGRVQNLSRLATARSSGSGTRPTEARP